MCVSSLHFVPAPKHFTPLANRDQQFHVKLHRLVINRNFPELRNHPFYLNNLALHVLNLLHVWSVFQTHFFYLYHAVAISPGYQTHGRTLEMITV
jgi:hypothetical protein